jgi:hypothetical protein
MTRKLSDPAPRAPMHRRQIECRGYRRDDGLWDIEGHMTDTRDQDLALRAEPRVVAAGEPIHDMWVRVTVDDALVVRAIEAATAATPTTICGGATAPMQKLVGLRIAAGWTNAVKERLGGPQGCTHLMELMWPIATTAWQTVSASRIDAMLAPATPGIRPAKIDSCWAYAAERDIVARFWPEHHTGPARS